MDGLTQTLKKAPVAPIAPDPDGIAGKGVFPGDNSRLICKGQAILVDAHRV
jgi:hypothetical protein